MSTTPSATLPPKRPPPRGIPLALSLPGGSSSSSSTSSSGSSVSRGGSSAVVSVSSASSSSTKATTTATSNSIGSSPYSIFPTSGSLNATSAAVGATSSSSSTTTAIPSARPSLAIQPIGGSSSSCPLLPASQSAASVSHPLSSPPPPPPPPLSAAPPLPDARSTTSTQSERSKQPHLSTVTSSLSNLSLDIPKCSSSSLSSSEKEGHHYYRPEEGRSQDDSDDNDDEDDPDPSRWGKEDQERMTGELLRVIRGPSATSLNLISTTTTGNEEDHLSPSVKGSVHPFGAFIGRGKEYSEKVGRNSRPNTGGSISSVSSSGTVYSLGNESSDTTDGLEHSSMSPFVTPLDVVPTTLKDLGKLGEGASGEVRKVLHLPTGIVMAKKTISTSPNPKLHKQHLRELLFMRECSNPHIVQYYGAFLEDNDSQIGICMEFCEGGSLEVLYKKVKKNGWRTGEKILAKIAESILSGLVYLHDRKIIHRDIKPSNVLVTKEGEIKLCDFGVSGELINSLAGTFVGTTFYLSPERIRGGQYSITSDVWSTGLTVLEVALNRFPFPAEGEAPLNGPIELLTYLVRMESPQLEDEPEYGIKYTNAFRNFIQLCLEKDPIRRPGPQKLLSHAWIRRSMERKPPPDLARWLRELKSE